MLASIEIRKYTKCNHWLSVTEIPGHCFFSGMDAEKHGEPAYPVAAWQEAWGDFMSGLSEEGNVHHVLFLSDHTSQVPGTKQG